MKRTERHIWTILALVVVFLIGIVIGMSIQHANASQDAAAPADITVMPCSAWADNATPTIPENTLTDACVDERGTLHTAPTSIEQTQNKN